MSDLKLERLEKFTPIGVFDDGGNITACFVIRPHISYLVMDVVVNNLDGIYLSYFVDTELNVLSGREFSHKINFDIINYTYDLIEKGKLKEFYSYNNLKDYVMAYIKKDIRSSKIKNIING